MDDDPLGTFGLGSTSIGIAVGVLFLVAMARSHAIYWAGRGVTRGARTVNGSHGGFGWWRSMLEHLEGWTNTRAARKGLDLVRRWGAYAVILAFVTIGVQTAVFASAGLIGMRYGRFTLATVPGALAWAVVWSTVGLGAVWGAVRLFATNPAALLAVVVLLAAGLAWWTHRRLTRRAEVLSPAD
ncbi:DedA family protein [Cellulomonas sp. HZM]|uniref:DedA family protein n=1 Tax=Cellulomonas sp. HZM TaxID=1454010 RepID=UPI00068C84CB|nr:hypothetical protein [Cellulomonas sp. HZM]